MTKKNSATIDGRGCYVANREKSTEYSPYQLTELKTTENLKRLAPKLSTKDLAIKGS